MAPYLCNMITQHDCSTLWSDTHNTWRITPTEPAPIIQAEMQTALPECMTPIRENPWYIWIHCDPKTGLTPFPP